MAADPSSIAEFTPDSSKVTPTESLVVEPADFQPTGVDIQWPSETLNSAISTTGTVILALTSSGLSTTLATSTTFGTISSRASSFATSTGAFVSQPHDGSQSQLGSSHSRPGLSTTTKAGIAIAILSTVVFLTLGAFFLCQHRLRVKKRGGNLQQAMLSYKAELPGEDVGHLRKSPIAELGTQKEPVELPAEGKK